MSLVTSKGKCMSDDKDSGASLLRGESDLGGQPKAAADPYAVMPYGATLAAMGVTVVELDDAIWNRGFKHSSASRLLGLSPYRHQCCIGIACTTLGVPDEQLRNVAYAHQLEPPPALLVRVPSDVYMANDRRGESDSWRIETINAAFGAADIPLRFVLKPSGSGSVITEQDRAASKS